MILLSDLNARFARLRITTPDRKPFTADIDSLATRVSDPAVTLTDAVGRVRLHADSLIFGLSRGALPDTRFSGGGAVTWPHDTTLFDFQVTSPQVNLDDLHWVSPDFPAMTGSGVLAAKSETGARTAYDIRELHLRNGDQRIDGDLVAITDRKRGLGFRDMRVTLKNLNLDAARAYVDSLPFFGTLSGTIAGAGFLDAMDITIDWTFADAKVPGQPVSRIAGEGIAGSTRDSGLTFTNFVVRRSDVDLHSVRRLAPAVILEGRLAAAGTLDGPLHNVTFRGTATQRDGDRPPSTATGTLYLDTRFDSLSLSTDVTFEPLSFEGIRRAFPTLKATGDLRGPFRGEGKLSRLSVDADLRGDLGDVTARGYVTLLPPHWGAEDLQLAFTRLDLARLSGGEAHHGAGRAAPRHGKHRHAAGARGGPRARARTESRARVDHRQPLRPGLRSRQRDPRGHRVRRMAGRARLRIRHAGLGGAARRPHALRPRRRQPDRLRFSAARGHRPGTGHVRRVAAARRAGGGARGPRRQPRLAPGRGRPRRPTASSGCGSDRRG